MVSELTVIVKDEEKNLKKKYLIYDSYQVDENDRTIKDCIKETLDNFDGEPSNIVVKISMEID